jgi:hypothetical protein
MKYKVILYNTSTSSEVDTSGNFTFYTLNSAVEVAQAWAALAASYRAYLWDGSVWRLYQ